MAEYVELDENPLSGYQLSASPRSSSCDDIKSVNDVVASAVRRSDRRRSTVNAPDPLEQIAKNRCVLYIVYHTTAIDRFVKMRFQKPSILLFLVHFSPLSF